jgi:hypothetical protein
MLDNHVGSSFPSHLPAHSSSYSSFCHAPPPRQPHRALERLSRAAGLRREPRRCPTRRLLPRRRRVLRLGQRALRRRQSRRVPCTSPFAASQGPSHRRRSRSRASRGGAGAHPAASAAAAVSGTRAPAGSRSSPSRPQHFLLWPVKIPVHRATLTEVEWHRR